MRYPSFGRRLELLSFDRVVMVVVRGTVENQLRGESSPPPPEDHFHSWELT